MRECHCIDKEQDYNIGGIETWYKDRREQRKVTETMNALLLPLLPNLNSDTAIIVKRALYLLGEIEIEDQKKMSESMTREDTYMRGCIVAIDKLIKTGSFACIIKVDGKWETVPWNEIKEWIEKQYGIEQEIKE